MSEKLLKVCIVGGGPAGLMTAWQLSNEFEVHLFEKESKIGKKFLVAGKGGLNITNSIEIEGLKRCYQPVGALDNALNYFNNDSLREWLTLLGIKTYVGSSSKVFPLKGTSAVDVLNRVKKSLLDKEVKIHTGYKLVGFDELMSFKFEHGGKIVEQAFDYAVLALGGASWPQTGSDGKWVNMLNKNGVATVPFQASNCGVNIDWPKIISEFHEGKPLKNIRVSCGPISATGEALVTKYGMEGTAIYPMIPALREYMDEHAVISYLTIDFKPMNSVEQLLAKLKGSTKYKDRLSLNSQQMAIIKSYTDKSTFKDPVSFCHMLKRIPIPVKSLRPIEEAISVTGGVAFGSINEDYSLVKFPKIYISGEMLDWDAPTGGFLLQACFSMGAYIGDVLRNKIDK